MTTYNERLDIYDRVFAFLLDMKITAIPTPLATICKRLNIELVPLSKIVSGTRLSAEEIFEKVWHNKDGHLMTYYEDGKYKLKIAYNDGIEYIDRVKFTIGEESWLIIFWDTMKTEYTAYTIPSLTKKTELHTNTMKSAPE